MFGYPASLVKEYSHWVVLLRPKQVTLGSLLLVAKSEAQNLGGLSGEEWGEFARVATDCEKLLKSKFGADKFNYLALMMKDPNVHFHFIPRYSRPVKYMGQEYIDKEWPLKTDLNHLELSDDVADNLLIDLKS